MTEDHFIRYLKHFKTHAKPSKERPIVLLSDNHDSHLSREALEYCKQNGETVLSFPAQCEHKLQSLDVSVCGPLKTYANHACDAWVTKHPGHTMTIYGVLVIVISSLHLAASPGTIKVGFKGTGICPINRDVSHGEEFMEVTLQIDLALLWLQQLPTVTMNLSPRDVD